MIEVSIIGKNSKLYNFLRKEIYQNFIVKCELSHSEVDKAPQLVNPIVFSFDPKSEISNHKLIDNIASKTIGKLIYISSTSSDVYDVVKMYDYPRLKSCVEKFVSTLSDYVIVRVGVVKDLTDISCFYGQIKLSSKDTILCSIIQCIDNNSDSGYLNAWCYEFIKGPLYKKIIYSFLFWVYKISPVLFYALRPLDFIFRKLRYYNYGYTFISNTQL